MDSIDLDGMIDYLCELISIPSYGGNETLAQLNVTQKMGDMGLDVDSWRIDFEELREHPAFSTSFNREEAINAVGTIEGLGGGRSLILNGHIDTVAPGDASNWMFPPLEGTVVDGRVYGRGACDMKGGLTSGLYAIKALMDAGVEFKGSLFFESVVGEEDGGCGTLAACLRGYRADAGIVMEPSETKIAPEIAGAMSFRVAVPGRSVHACVREEGISAIDKFTILYKGLKELERERNEGVDNPMYARYSTPYAINVGRVEGGLWPGTVPETLVFEGRIGVAVDESKEQARMILEKKIEEIADGDAWLRAHRPRLEWVGYSFAPSKIPVDHSIVETVREAYTDVTGKQLTLEGMTYASDARRMINVAQTPTTVFGPGDVRTAHGPNEYVPIVELETTVRTLALTLLRFVCYKD